MLAPLIHCVDEWHESLESVFPFDDGLQVASVLQVKRRKGREGDRINKKTQFLLVYRFVCSELRIDQQYITCLETI